MSIRDLLVTAIILGSLPFCFLKPWVGILVWSWVGYMNPHRLAWGFASSFPFGQLIALATLAGFLFIGKRSPLPRSKGVFFLLVFLGVMILSTIFSFYPEDAGHQMIKVLKIFLMVFLTIMLMQDRHKLKMLLWVIALSIGFFGLKGGIWGILTGGQFKVLGPADSFLAGNTEVGLALNMVLPIIAYLRGEEERPWVRHLLTAIFVFSIVAVVLTYSRGAILGLGVVLAFLFLKGKAKVRTFALLVVGIALAAVLLPEQWFGRMETMKTYREDASAMGRLVAWRVSWLMALDRPILGYGFQPFTPELYRRFIPEQSNPEYEYHVAHSADAHNIFFQVLAEHGFTGLFLFLGVILSTYFSLRRVIRKTRDDPSALWMANCARMIEAGLFAYVANGFFLSRSYFDLFYHFVAIAIILRSLQEAHEREGVPVLEGADPRSRDLAPTGS